MSAQGASTASLGLTSGAPPTYAVRCVGLCSDADAPQLHNLLKSMSLRRSYHDENEYGIKVPLQSNSKEGRFKMIKQAPPNVPGGTVVPLGPSYPVIWRLVHESPPLRGSQYNSLPAAVMEVSESALYGIYSVQTLVAIGCECTYRVQRQNYVYTCSHEALEIQVSLFHVLDRPSRPGAHPTKLFPGCAVEARVTVGPEQQIEAAKKVGSFCERLLPLVVMKKA